MAEFQIGDFVKHKSRRIGVITDVRNEQIEFDYHNGMKITSYFAKPEDLKTMTQAEII